MIQLNSQRYHVLLPFLDNIKFNTLFARSVIDKKVSGKVFVDNVRKPKTFLITHLYGMALLGGDHENLFFNHKLKEYLLNQAGANIKIKTKWILIYSDIWKDELLRLLSKQNEINYCVSQSKITLTQRINFKFDKKKFNPNPVFLDSNYHLVKIDNTLFNRIKGVVVPRYFWNSAAEFMEHGVGYSLIKGDEIISTAFSSFFLNNQLEIGVETTHNYQKKGLAVYPVIQLLNYCLENNYEPVWGCSKINQASFKLAQKVGFSPESYHPYYTLSV